MTKQEYRHYSHLYRNADRLRAQAERYFQTSCAKYWLAQQVGFSAILPGSDRRITIDYGDNHMLTGIYPASALRSLAQGLSFMVDVPVSTRRSI